MINEIILGTSFFLGIGPIPTMILLLVVYFLPSIIERCYKKTDGNLIFWNVFLGWTPIPYIIMIINIIEKNKTNEEIIKKMNEIEKKLDKILVFEGLIDLDDQKEKSEGKQ